MVGWEQPELFYNLPCQYNYQERSSHKDSFSVCNENPQIYHRFSHPIIPI